MDTIKIGKYIAGKRKELELTQKQLAEQLGMSDKSVSKWERGICLPDVSVYMELCDILGISINEFLAGEDISEEKMIKKSEDNLLQVVKDSKDKQRYLKRVIAVLLILTVVAVTILGITIYQKMSQPQNYIVAVSQGSTEMKMAELLSESGQAYLFKYYSKEQYQTLNIYLSEYRAGELIAKESVTGVTVGDMEFNEEGTEGMIAVIPEDNHCGVRVIVTEKGVTYSTSTSIMKGVDDAEYYGRSATCIEGIIPIQYNAEQSLMSLIYGEEGLSAIPIESIESGEAEFKNDFDYYFTFEFVK